MPWIGFSVHLRKTTALIKVKITQMLTNLHQKFLRDKHTGIIHIPINVQN